MFLTLFAFGQQDGATKLLPSESGGFPGCLSPVACNYDESADFDDGSCEFPGCLDEEALNYDPEATIDSEDCIYECELPEASFEVVGCDENEFTVEVSISDLGNGAPYTVSNSVNDETLVIDEEGTFDVAGFPIGDVVVITIESTFGDVCTVTSTELGCPFSIDEENQLSLNVFPNPANATLTIQSSGNAWSSVQVIDLAGRIVRDEQIMLTSTGVVIETSTLAEGDYLVRITSEGSTVTEKVMIQH